MRPVFLMLMLAFLSPSTAGATHGTGNDDTGQPGDVANCNASFQEDCHHDEADAASSSSVAAPIGDWANSTLEMLVLLAMIAGALWNRGASCARVAPALVSEQRPQKQVPR